MQSYNLLFLFLIISSPFILVIVASWWLIKKAWVLKSPQNPNLNVVTTFPGRKTSKLDVASLCIGIISLVLPYLILFFLASLPGPLLSKVYPVETLEAANRLVYITIFISLCVGASAVVFGIRALRDKDRDNIPRSWKNLASAGIILGISTIPCVLLPLLIMTVLARVCEHGC